jgi:hypothetical protein
MQEWYILEELQQQEVQLFYKTPTRMLQEHLLVHIIFASTPILLLAAELLLLKHSFTKSLTLTMECNRRKFFGLEVIFSTVDTQIIS